MSDPRPSVPPADDGLGPVPPENRPGHHPTTDQDKPEGPPPRPVGAEPREVALPFRFHPVLRWAALPFGVLPGRAEVVVGEHDLTVRFGPWSLHTPLDNIESATVTGPYSWPRVVGPPRLSLTDGGITFATTDEEGVCLELHEPVRALLPFGPIRHRGVTVTVEDPRALVDAVDAAIRRERHAS